MHREMSKLNATDHALRKSDFQPNTDRRAEQRVNHRRRIRLLPCVARSNWSFREAELVDCSTRGLALLLDETMSPGEQFLVPLRMQKVRLLMYTVRNCQSAGPRRYRVGAEFSGFTASEYDGDPADILKSMLEES